MSVQLGDIVFIDAAARIRKGRVRHVARTRCDVAWTKRDGGVRVSKVAITDCHTSEAELRAAHRRASEERYARQHWGRELPDDYEGRESIPLAPYEPPRS